MRLVKQPFPWGRIMVVRYVLSGEDESIEKNRFEALGEDCRQQFEKMSKHLEEPHSATVEEYEKSSCSDCRMVFEMSMKYMKDVGEESHREADEEYEKVTCSERREQFKKIMKNVKDREQFEKIMKNVKAVKDAGELETLQQVLSQYSAPVAVPVDRVYEEFRKMNTKRVQSLHRWKKIVYKIDLLRSCQREFAEAGRACQMLIGDDLRRSFKKVYNGNGR